MSTTLTLDVGDRLRATGTFTDPDDDSAVTPDAVFFAVEDPAGTVVTYEYGVDDEVSLVSTGVYRLAVEVDSAGKWKVRCYSTGAGQAAEAGAVTVRKNPIHA